MPLARLRPLLAVLFVFTLMVGIQACTATSSGTSSSSEERPTAGPVASEAPTSEAEASDSGGAVDGVTRAAPAPPPASGALSERGASGLARMESRERDASRSDDEASPARRSPPRQGRAGLLTAGDVDDNLNWGAFQRYVARARRGQDRSTPRVDLDDRLMVRVVDAVGQPVANARLTIEAEGGRRARRLTTEAGTDGRLALFPVYDFGPGVRRLRLRAEAPDRRGEAVALTVDDLTGDRPHALDLAVVIDVTGSMGDELAYLASEFESIVRRVERRYRGTDLRFALVAYRDHGDDMVVRSFPFVRSAREMQQQLGGLRAQGGGDYPEAMDEALQAAVDLDWRTGEVARVAFLVADAPPHPEGVDRFLGAVRQARAAGVRVYPLAASGVGDAAEYLMRHAAVLTQARHLFLTDDSGIGNSHQEPKIPCYAVTQLDGLITRVIASELEGRRVEPAREEILREVGDYDAGVCEAGPVALGGQPQRPTPRRGGLGYD